MNPDKKELSCPVCGQRVPAHGTCPHCRGQVSTSPRGIQRGAWMLVGGALLFLVALFLWVNQLQDQATPAPEGEAPGGELEPDGTATPGPAVFVPFEGERCVPWHVSAAQQPPADDSLFLVVTSQVADSSGLILSGFGAECGERHPVLVLERLEPGDLTREIEKHKPTALVTAGMASYLRAREEGGDLPILFAGVTNPVGAGLDAENRAGVTPWLPAQPLVRHMLKVLPKKKTLAVIHSPGALGKMARSVTGLFETAGRKVTRFEVTGPENLADVLEKAAEASNAWIVLPDRKIIDLDLFNRILVAAENRKIPVGVSDEEHVRYGALVGVGPDTHRIGRQLCRLAGAMSRDALPAGSHVFCPEYSFAVINIAVAEKLGYLFDPVEVRQVKTYKWH